MEAGALPGTSGSHYQSDGHFEKDKNVEKPGSLSENYRAYFDEDNKLKFYPPLYKQRYEAVQEILRDGRWSPPVATVVEFGCAELAMFNYFKRISDITKVIMVDIDSDLLDHFHCRASPLTCDYVCPRENPLHVEVLCGSVAECDVRLLGANAVVCIELIEHLELDIVEKLEETIFGCIQPDIAIFTTPNSDFNVLLSMKEKFRHYDHKFEWSQKEFENWTKAVLAKFPYYRVELRGVGAPPEKQEHVGYCSQLALFIRNSDYTPKIPQGVTEVYTICRVYEHPVKPIDTRSDEDKLNDEISFSMYKLGQMYQYYDENDCCSYVPLTDLTNAVQRHIPSADTNAVRCLLCPEVLIERHGQICINFEAYSSKDDDGNSDNDEEAGINWIDEERDIDEQEEESWDNEPAVEAPLTFSESSQLTEYHMALAACDNATNLVHERQHQYNLHHNLGFIDSYIYDDDEDDEDDLGSEPFDDDDGEIPWPQRIDCEREWNASKSPMLHSQHIPTPRACANTVLNPSATRGSDIGILSSPNSSSILSNLCAIVNLSDDADTKREPITDSGVDLSPVLNQVDLQAEVGDVFPGSSKFEEIRLRSVFCRASEFPKSTSVEVLHLDGTCTLRRSPGLELVEFAPSTSVTLCYTGQTYCDSDKHMSKDNMFMSSERKSLDGSLVKDTLDSCSLDFAGDSGYPNSSSLHHDVDVDLTPEQVDDISSENDDQSNQSLSEDELSESSDRAPALPRRVIHPRHPVVPIVVENVENGDLANNNRDGEGNNAVAPLGDEREFVALVQEGEMQPLMAAPVDDDVILLNNADPFPDWLLNLERPENCGNPSAKVCDDEIDCDEGLGEDSHCT